MKSTQTKAKSRAKTKTKAAAPVVKKIYDETYNVVGTQFAFMAPDMKTAKILLQSSMAHQWLAKNLGTSKTIKRTADLPSTDAPSFLQKSFYYTTANVVRNIFEAGVPLDEAISVGNQIVTSNSPTLMEFAPYVVISKVVREQLKEAIACSVYK